jgi:hypothetical protein
MWRFQPTAAYDGHRAVGIFREKCDFMKSKFLGLVACMALFGVTQAAASTITYNVSDTAGSLSYTGTITTDGHTGILGSTDISDWSLTITGYTATYTLTPSNSSIVFDGTSGLAATLTTLSWDTSSTITSQSDFSFKLQNGFNRALVEYSQSANYSPSVLSLDAQDAIGGLTFAKDLASFDTFGTAPATTPLPSTWLMLLSGFVGLGFFAYRGTKKNAAALAA